jgi:hypothetical protein
LIVSGLPAGASGTFATSPLALASSNPSTNKIILTINTTNLLVAGTYNFTVKGTNTASLSADNKSGSGTLTVNFHMFSPFY